MKSPLPPKKWNKLRTMQELCLKSNTGPGEWKALARLCFSVVQFCCTEILFWKWFTPWVKNKYWSLPNRRVLPFSSEGPVSRFTLEHKRKRRSREREIEPPRDEKVLFWCLFTRLLPGGPLCSSQRCARSHAESEGLSPYYSFNMKPNIKM